MSLPFSHFSGKSGTCADSLVLIYLNISLSLVSSLFTPCKMTISQCSPWPSPPLISLFLKKTLFPSTYLLNYSCQKMSFPPSLYSDTSLPSCQLFLQRNLPMPCVSATNIATNLYDLSHSFLVRIFVIPLLKIESLHLQWLIFTQPLLHCIYLISFCYIICPLEDQCTSFSLSRSLSKIYFSRNILS